MAVASTSLVLPPPNAPPSDPTASVVSFGAFRARVLGRVAALSSYRVSIRAWLGAAETRTAATRTALAASPTTGRAHTPPAIPTPRPRRDGRRYWGAPRRGQRQAHTKEQEKEQEDRGLGDRPSCSGSLKGRRGEKKVKEAARQMRCRP